MAETAMIGSVDAPGLHVMTYNIRRRIARIMPNSPDRWTRRRPLLRRLLQTERPTLLGVQEALPDQAETVLEALGSAYRRIGYGRSANRDGEECPIYYDADRLSLLDWAQQALSDTPHTPGSMSWGNWIPRVLVRARFRDRVTGGELDVINTHLDHLSRKSRLRSAVALHEIADGCDGPVVLTGDFNTAASTAPHDTLTARGVLCDSWLTAGERLSEAWGTFPGYREPQLGHKRIDWILTSPTVEVRRTAINVTRKAGEAPSDHAPVQAVVQLTVTGDR